MVTDTTAGHRATRRRRRRRARRPARDVEPDPRQSRNLSMSESPRCSWPEWTARSSRLPVPAVKIVLKLFSRARPAAVSGASAPSQADVSGRSRRVSSSACAASLFAGSVRETQRGGWRAGIRRKRSVGHAGLDLSGRFVRSLPDADSGPGSPKKRISVSEARRRSTPGPLCPVPGRPTLGARHR
jgi:hypothetical protein